MKIRTKLTLIFFCIVIVILTAVSLSIYFFSADYREQDFYSRMKNKAENTAKLLIEVDEVDLDLLKRIERDNPGNLPNERIRIFNFRNEEIYSSDPNNELPINTALLNQIRLREEIRFMHGQFEVLGFLFAYEYDRFTVVVGATDRTGFRKLANLREILMIVFAISIVLVSFAGWVYAGRMLRPISTIVRKVDRISDTSLDLRLQEGNGQDELAKLSQTFNQMLDRLEQSFVAQKSFIANASHELRTPITALTGEIEVTLLQPRTVSEYEQVLRSLLDNTKRLNLLSSQLLLLAQTAAIDPSNKFSQLRIDDVLWETKNSLEKANPGYSVHVEFEIDLSDDDLMVHGDEQLLKVAFSNLAENGCKYSTDQRVTVKIESPDSDALVVRFIDHGIGLAQEDIPNIFNPFYRGRNTDHIKGTGIGLSLVSRIIRLHNGSVDVRSIHGEETCFTVTFFRAPRLL